MISRGMKQQAGGSRIPTGLFPDRKGSLHPACGGRRPAGIIHAAPVPVSAASLELDKRVSQLALQLAVSRQACFRLAARYPEKNPEELTQVTSSLSR